jgi:hypothetical protein
MGSALRMGPGAVGSVSIVGDVDGVMYLLEDMFDAVLWGFSLDAGV